ncbi:MULTISPECIES: TonB-dependent receptor [unclassified Pseudomonas]|uniref:TonB-dependent receptor n=1 Tax=unclassified Pseudomonas TaxID=196821 RepID=UPI0021C73E63|nr:MULTISPECIES: TonB-dependent receptor [unclassified Pseudomonas]MCU1733770.1 TonB-dependent hemoglobin/transferrin/lactoferrin family receptor [Pseudomonas sp. 20P_3.2_Bac4]MCU1746214.1 TonB-dependent hemoglobin/transferrin/lactoferrin family receptor [Pseudomonas sp. 20P_3.2_Bac5]
MFRAFRPSKPLSARPSLLAVCLALSLQAQAAPVELQLPAQPLATSLSQVAQQTKVQLLFDESLLRNVSAPALRGNFSAEEAIARLLASSRFTLVKVGTTYVVRPKEDETTPPGNNNTSIQLGAMSIVGDGQQVTPATVGRSTLTQRDIDREQANNVPSLLSTLPGVEMAGSMMPGGQKINIWGMGDAEDVQLTVDGATKTGFERYQQGTMFVEPELIKSIEVEKGPHSPFVGNTGLAGSVHMTTKNAPDLLQEGRDTGAMVKYGYSSNDHQQVYSTALFGRTEDRRIDGLVYLTKRDGDDFKLASSQPDPRNQYPINPKRLPDSAQDLEGGLFKLNVQLTDEQSLGLSYSRSNNQRMTRYSSTNYSTPPTQANIDRYGYSDAIRRFLAHRETIDTTWSAKYRFQPVDNPLVNLEVSYSESDVDQTDERGPNAFFQLATGGRRMETEYKDRNFEVRNTAQFSTGVLEHSLTTGAELHRHSRETEMWMPGTAQNTAAYNYGHFQPNFMPHGKVDTNSAYVQDAITLGQVTITPSLRYDHVRNRGEDNDAPFYNVASAGHDYSAKTYTGWSPRLSVFWRATDDVAFFADYSKTWRAPVIDEQYEVQSAVSTRSATSRDLDPERVTALRAGNVTDFSGLFFADDNLQVRTTLFHNKIKDEIFKNLGVECQAQNVTGGSISQACGNYLIGNYRNLDGVTYKGFEVESFYDSTYLFGTLSYTWMTGKHEGAYNNPWGPDVWARDVPAPKWVARLGVKIPEWDVVVGWKGLWVRQTDRLPSDKYPPGFMGSALGDSAWDHRANDAYNVQGLFASWKPKQQYLKGTEVNFTLDNMFNRDYVPMLSDNNVYSTGRNAKVSITRFF